MKNVTKALPALLGVMGGILLYVLNRSQPKSLLFFIIQFSGVAILATALLLIGKILLSKHPRLGMILLEFWILFAIAINSGTTFLILWVTTNSPSWFSNLNAEESKTVVGALVGAITTFFAVLWTKDIEEGKGYFSPSYHFKKRMGTAFSTSESMPIGDTKEYDSIYEERVRENGPTGWGLKARWQRATIMSNHLKKTTPNNKE